MSHIHESRATLRFFGEDLDPDEITRLLGKKPYIGERRGDIVTHPDGTGARALKQGRWVLRATDVSPADLNAQIAELLDVATTDMNVWRTLTGRFDADIFCGLFMQGEDGEALISPETCLRIGERGLTLVLDVWPGETKA